MSDKIIEIVKRIEAPKRESEDNNEKEKIKEIEKVEKAIYIDESFYTEEYQEEKKKSSKKVLPILLGITTIGVMGYLGVKYLNQDKQVNQTPNNIISNHIVNKKADKKADKITTYTEELAMKKELSAIEKNVISSLSAYKAEAKEPEVKEDVKEIVKEPVVKKDVKEIVKEPVVKEDIKEIVNKPVVKEEKEIEKKIDDVPASTIKTIEPISIPKDIKIESKKKKEEKIVVVKKKEIIKKNKIVQKKKIDIIKYEPIKPRIIRVRRGESLASIAKRFYGNDMDFRRIIRANSRIRSSKTHLRFGEKIIIPRKDNKTRRRYVIVKKGYTLAYIAKKVYGSRDKISKIVRANYKIKSRNSTLRLGQKVYVPE